MEGLDSRGFEIINLQLLRCLQHVTQSQGTVRTDAARLEIELLVVVVLLRTHLLDYHLANLLGWTSVTVLLPMRCVQDNLEILGKSAV